MSPRVVEPARRISSGDRGVRAFHQQWRTLFRRVSRRFWWLDQATIEDAVSAALLRWLEQEGSAVEGARQGTKELCFGSLFGAACRNVGDSIRSDTRRDRRERAYACQKKIWQNEGFFVPSGLSAANTFIEEELIELEELLESCSSEERALVELRKQGTKDWTAYTAVLGVEQCPFEEQRRAFNRIWNRLRKKLQRLRKTLHPL